MCLRKGVKELWLARLPRPQIQGVIGVLASNVTKWSKNDDRRLERLSAYMQHNRTECLVGFIKDFPELLKLLLFVGADLCGDPDSTRLTSGMLLVLAGPNSWFPIARRHCKQSATARSPTESEVAALVAGLFGETIPFPCLL